MVEIILSLSALFKGLYQVVSTSLLGSILSNMLFVLGMSFMAGGAKWVAAACLRRVARALGACRHWEGPGVWGGARAPCRSCP